MAYLDKVDNQKRFFRDFGMSMSVMHLGNTMVPSLFGDYWYKVCLEKIWSDFQNEITRSFPTKNTAISNDCPIWIMWWQGLDSETPPLVRCCLDSVEKHAGKHPIRIITKKNYQNYITLPEWIVEKFQKKYVSIQNLSDIIRFALLRKWGGVWLDATIYLNNSFDVSMYDYSYYSAKNLNWQPALSVWSNKWAGFFTAGSKEMPLFEVMYDCFSAYWEKYDVLLDYFLIDLLMWSIYYNNENIREVIDSVPENNPNLYRLEESFNRPADAFVPDSGEIFYKLSMKTHHDMFLENGEPTLYNKIVSPFFN